MATKKQIQDRIEEIGPDVMMLGAKKEIKHLAEMIIDGEEVLYLTSGAFEANTWLVVLTTNRVIFLNSGLIYGCETFEISLNQIHAIKPKTGWFFGELTIADGGSEYTVRNIVNKKVKRFVREVNLALHSNKTPSISDVENKDLLLDKCLAELELLDSKKATTEITDPEFHLKRREIISAILS